MEVDGDKILVLLPNNFLVAGDNMEFIEISQLISQGLSKQFIVIFWRGNVLGEDGGFLKFLVDVLGIEPVVLRFMFYDL